MDHNGRNSGIGSKDPPRTMSSDPSKGGRVAATALGRPSHDHVKRKEPPRISKDHVKLKPQHKIDRSENDRERDILNQSIKRAKGGEGPNRAVRDESGAREREILSQSLKRTKPAAGGEDREVKGEKRERDILKKSSDDSKARLDNSMKSKSATRPDDLKVKSKSTATRPDGTKLVVKKDATRPGDIVKKENLSSDRLEKSKSAATRPDGARAAVKPGDAVKRESLASDTRKRTMGVVKAEDVQRSVTKNGRDVSKEPLRAVKVVTGTVMKAKQEKVKKKAFSLPGQRFEAPEERDALRLFYGSLHQQIPTSDMANIWLMEHGLLEADEAQKVLTQKVKSKSGPVFKTPTPSKFSNGSAAGKASKFRSEDFLDIKPVSNKLKL